MKKLTRQEYHHALALFIIARRQQEQVVKLETEMNAILGDENGSQASDAIYTQSSQDEQRDFNEALRKMGIAYEAQEQEETRFFGEGTA